MMQFCSKCTTPGPAASFGTCQTQTDLVTQPQKHELKAKVSPGPGPCVLPPPWPCQWQAVVAVTQSQQVPALQPACCWLQPEKQLVQQWQVRLTPAVSAQLVPHGWPLSACCLRQELQQGQGRVPCLLRQRALVRGPRLSLQGRVQLA